MTRQNGARTGAWALVLATLWLALTGGAPGALPIGVLVVAGALAVARTLGAPQPGRLSLAGAARFVPYFLWHSLQGGADVAWRAFHPGLPLAPRMLTHRTRLPPGRARTFFVGVVSLLPGTLSADLSGRELLVHVIGGGEPAAPRLRALEAAVGRLFGEPVAPDRRDG